MPLLPNGVHTGNAQSVDVVNRCKASSILTNLSLLSQHFGQGVHTGGHTRFLEGLLSSLTLNVFFRALYDLHCASPQIKTISTLLDLSPHTHLAAAITPHTFQQLSRARGHKFVRGQGIEIEWHRSTALGEKSL